MSLEKEQLRLTYHARSYLNKIKKKNISQLKSVFCYFSIWTPSPGLSRIRILRKNFFEYVNFIFAIFKGIIAISRQSNFITINNKKKRFIKIDSYLGL